MTVHVYSKTVTTQVLMRGGINMSKGIQQMKNKKRWPTLLSHRKLTRRFTPSAIVGMGSAFLNEIYVLH
jgi:hypothetical protein